MSYFSDSDTKNKLLIMYFIQSSGLEISEEDLLSIAIEKKWMDYFEFAMSLSELKQAGFLRKNRRAGGDRLTLSEEGGQAVGEFYKRLPQSLRDNVDEYNAENKRDIQRKGENFASLKRKENGEYSANFKIIDSDGELLNLELSLPNGEIAKSFVSKWNEKAEDIYSFLISTLG